MAWKGRTLIITGASDGIGAELARQLASAGANLVLAARRAEPLDAVAAECGARGGRAVAVATDVTRDDDCRALAERAVGEFGGIDVLVCNAGVSMHAFFDEITDPTTFERLWRINCLGTIQCVRHAYPHLKRSRGHIVGVASLAGKTGVPARTTYCSSKFAQAGFLDALRVEAADYGIAVTVAYPGVVATDIRRNGLDGRGLPAGFSGLDEADAMPVDECARRIIGAMRARRRELVMTARGRFGLWLKMLAPHVVDNIARSALAREGHRQGPAARQPGERP
jgi:NAD(P)-dependent dehydrogenase (short-subunit alcohol dehydrogenase family)